MAWLDNLKINNKLMLIILIIIIGFAVLVLNAGDIVRNSMYQERHAMIDNITETSEAILKEQDELYKQGVLSLEEAQEKARTQIR